jgi:hypothetical protein
MHPYVNQDVAFERLKDLQREVENSRLMAASVQAAGSRLRNLAARARRLGALAVRGAPRRRPIPAHHACDEANASDAA